MERLLAHLIALLALAAGQEQTTQSPRALIERAAYVEEHERDFVQAAALFQQAENAARTAGDEATAREAAAGRQRAEARRDGAPGRSDPAQDAAIDNRVGDLLSKLAEFSPSIGSNDERWLAFKALQDDLQVYGSAAAPRLESLLEPRMIDIGDYRVGLDTNMAARLLATLAVDAAAEGLGRGLQSKDPLIRRAIAVWLDPTRHRALLEQAARDPVSQVRSVAIAQLLRFDDPALQPLAEAEARNGHSQAFRWLAQRDPQRLLDILAERGADVQRGGLEYLGSAALPATRENAERLLRFAREGSHEDLRAAALETLQQLFRRSWSGASSEVKLLVQERLLAEPGRYAEEERNGLLRFGDVRAFEFLSRRWAGAPAGSTDANVLANYCANMVAGMPVEDFATLVRLVRAIPGSDTSWHRSVWDRLDDIGGHVSMQTLLAGLDGLEGEERTNYMRVVRAWLMNQPFWQAGSVAPETIDPALIPVLREMLEISDASIEPTGFHGLRLARDFSSLPRMIGRGRHQETIRELVRLDPDRAAGVILEAIVRGEIRPRSIEYLKYTGRELQLFQDAWQRVQDPGSRAELLASLVDFEGGEVDGVFLELWPEIAEADTRAHAIGRFGQHLYEPAIPILGLALEDPEQFVREKAREAFRAFKEQREALEEYAAWTLGDHEARTQVQDLIELLASPERKVVLGAVKALGAVRGRAALPALVRLLEREDPELEAAVMAAIEAIGQ